MIKFKSANDMPINKYKNQNNTEKLVYPRLSYDLCGIMFGIHNKLGRYCSELQYGDALEKVLQDRKIQYDRELFLKECFEGEKPRRNKVDFLIDNKIIVELKCRSFLSKEEYFQVKRYLISARKKLGLLVNFREKYLKPRRILNSQVIN